MASDHEPVTTRRNRPRSATVFIAAFVAGAAAAVGINRVLDVHLAQSKPQVECEPIFVALRSLSQGMPVTVWDVALRDWPKAMMPSSALRVNDSFEGYVLKHPLREGQPLLAVQLLRPTAPVLSPAADEPVEAEEVFVPPVPATAQVQTDADLWPPAATSAIASPAAVAIAMVPPQTAPAAQPQPDIDPERESQPEPEPTAAEIALDDVTPTEPPRDVPTEALATSPAEPASDLFLAADPQSAADTEHVPNVAATAVAAAAPTEPAGPSTAPAVEPTVAPVEPIAKPLLAAIRREPTPAVSILDAPLGPAPTPGPLEPPTASQLATDVLPPIDLTSRPAADIASLPSVMAHDKGSSPINQPEPQESSVRYLVVPERIARQADTSFTTPAAPSVGAVEQQPDPTASRPTVAQQGTAPKTATRTPNRTANGSRPQPNSKPNPKQQAREPQQRPAERAAATESRTWGGMFPNVSAGLEAISNWRSGGREDVADERPAIPPRR